MSPTPSGVFDTGPLMMGEEKQVAFDKEGTFNYFCTIHPFMRGSITVES
jgi:plastocyanin